jgi:class 3 adenylate cyclase
MMTERGVLNMLTGREINVGIGIATGDMLAGFMGSEDRLNFTVIGQGANLASRLCTVAAPMEILMDEATSMAVDEKGEMLPPLEIKGFTEPQAVFCLKTGKKGELDPSTPQEMPAIN